MRVLEGKIIANKMTNTVVVEVIRYTPHRLYGKLIKKSKKFFADTGDKTYEIGQVVRIVETRPMSKNKHFKIMEGGAK